MVRFQADADPDQIIVAALVRRYLQGSHVVVDDGKGRFADSSGADATAVLGMTGPRGRGAIRSA